MFFRHTVEFCRRLEKAGVSFLTIHGRTASQHTGNINSEILKLVKEAVNCPIIANGDVKTLDDCFDLQEKTNCNGTIFEINKNLL